MGETCENLRVETQKPITTLAWYPKEYRNVPVFLNDPMLPPTMYSSWFKLLLSSTTVVVLVVVAGCQTNKKLATSFASDSATVPTLGDSFLKISNPTECDDECAPSNFDLDSISPNAMVDYQNISYTPISLSDCIAQALQDSEVFRDLGGTIVNQPNNIETSLDPALVYLDPQLGEQAALSAFDANIAANLYFEKNDRPFNNRFSGSTEGILVQDLGEYELEISKLAATGTLFTARHRIIYDDNNQAGNRFQGSFWEAIIDAGFRHPLLQGSGSMFNRIAGPSQIPGQYNGVLIARTNTEISLAEFEQSTRELVANVENAYWDLYYAYRELDAQTDARDAAYEVFKRTEAQAGTQRIPGLEKASAEEQYLRFEAAIIESLEGRTINGTQANSGITGGSFRRTAGVRVAERRLRYLIGMPITDGMLLQPVEIPTRAAVVFDWDSSVDSAINRRPETRRQRWVLKQKELELTAARNFLMPRLDLVGNYRFRGLGKNLTGGGETLRDDIINNTQESGAYSDLAGGDFQELQIGAELRMPVGYRQANAAVRAAELGVQRARKVLDEQERRILLDLSNAIAETRRAFSAMDVSERRFRAAVTYRDQAASRIESGRSQMDVLLEAQRRILEAQLQHISAEVEYTQAIKNVHFERGSYLMYHGIQLQESLSDAQAYEDAAVRYSKRTKTMSYAMRDATISNLSDHLAAGSEGVVGADSALPVDGMFIENGTIEANVLHPFDNMLQPTEIPGPPPSSNTIQSLDSVPGSSLPPSAPELKLNLGDQASMMNQISDLFGLPQDRSPAAALLTDQSPELAIAPPESKPEPSVEKLSDQAATEKLADSPAIKPTTAPSKPSQWSGALTSRRGATSLGDEPQTAAGQASQANFQDTPRAAGPSVQPVQATLGDASTVKPASEQAQSTEAPAQAKLSEKEMVSSRRRK